jgi:hypothetical protein
MHRSRSPLVQVRWVLQCKAKVAVSAAVVEFAVVVVELQTPGKEGPTRVACENWQATVGQT